MNPYKILVVDDEEDLCEILQFNLENEGYKVDVAYSAEEALKLDITQYHLLLLDVMMGEISGFRMAKMLRDEPKTANIPVIFLTAKDSENDRITGFTVGADDYILKPYSIREVLARVKAVLRRIDPNTLIQYSSANLQVIAYEGLQMILDTKRVLLDGKPLSFTKKEFEILKLLLENRNRVFAREEILTRIWPDEVVVLDRTIDVNITRLRKKVGIYGKNIVTRLGYGYCFEE